MLKVTHKVLFENGIHSRKAIALVDISRKYDNDVKMYYKGNMINIRSIIAILASNIKKDDEVSFLIEGQNEELISKEIEDIFKI